MDRKNSTNTRRKKVNLKSLTMKSKINFMDVEDELAGWAIAYTALGSFIHHYYLIGRND